MAEKTVKKGTKSNQAKGSSTGLKKLLNQEDKMYEPRKKGTGKLKYQNVVKEGRANTKKRQVDNTTFVKEKLAGKKVTKQEKRAIGNKAENVAKQIDREEKVRKGVRTEKPSTKKVPVKPRGGAGMRGGLGSFGSGSGMRGSVNK
jgi:hypothetical protein